MPDRADVGMTRHFLRSYAQLVIKTCHKRGAYAIGGMAAQIPIKNDEEANRIAIEKVRVDKEREVTDGHDGTWVAHPALVPLAMDIFNEHMPGPNQLDKKRDDVDVNAADLLQVPQGKITEDGLRENVRVSILYLAAWLAGNGCVPINHLMEDAATAEISRAQVWQWVHHDTGILDTGKNVSYGLFKAIVREEMGDLRDEMGDEAFSSGKYRDAARILDVLTQRDTFTDFLTLEAYAEID